jgi:hypothetical protein
MTIKTHRTLTEKEEFQFFEISSYIRFLCFHASLTFKLNSDNQRTRKTEFG